MPTLEQQTSFQYSPYVTARDVPRILRGIDRVKNVLADREWHTLAEVSQKSAVPEASASAAMRALRRAEFGSHTIVLRRYTPYTGQFEYRLEN